MILFFVILVGGVIAAIIFFAASDPNMVVKTSEDFVKKLETFLEAKAENLEGKKDCFKIYFLHDGFQLCYEDVQEPSFNDQIIRKAYLRLDSKTKFSMEFQEKQKRIGVHSDIMMTSKLVEAGANHLIVKTPRQLDVFDISTNDNKKANRLLLDQKVLKTFVRFKNFDSKKHPYMSLYVVNGIIVLEFSSIESFEPNVYALQRNIPSLEDYSDILLFLNSEIQKETEREEKVK